jgi:small subunit ribosomal protein S18
MARSSNRNEKPRRPRPERERRGAKRKVCIFCQEKSIWVDYKDVGLLRRFVSDRGKIRARRVSGCCSQHQREVAVAVKTARELALLPYTQRTTSERGPGRGPRRDDGEGGGDRGDRGDRRGPRRDADPVDAELADQPTSFGPDDEGDDAAVEDEATEGALVGAGEEDEG